MSKEITIRVINSGRVHWHNFKFLQSDNLKDLSKKSHQALRDSIINNNFVESFKIWRSKNDLFCLDGFHRCKILEELEEEGYIIPKLMPADFLECKDKREASKLVVVFTAKYARITEEGLSQFLEEQELDWDDFKSEIDWSDFNLDRFEAGRGNGYNPEEDDIPEPPIKPVSKLGDLYLLDGRHRLLCGDCEKELNKLLDGAKIDLVFTDPPYGINIVKTDKATIGGSKPVTINSKGKVGFAYIAKANKYYSIYGDNKPFNPKWIINTFKGNKILFGANHYASKLLDSRCWIVWDKQVFGTFSPIEMAWTDFDKLPKLYSYMWSGLRREGGRDEELIKRIHPTQKPVGLFKMILQDFSEENQNIWDGYGGSGSTLIACEQTNRTCYMSEIEPMYIDVIIERYKNLTGKGVELIDRIKTKKRRRAQ